MLVFIYIFNQLLIFTQFWKILHRLNQLIVVMQSDIDQIWNLQLRIYLQFGHFEFQSSWNKPIFLFTLFNLD